MNPPLPLAIFVALFMLMFAAFGVCLGFGMLVVIVRGMIGTLRNLGEVVWRDLLGVPVATLWIIVCGLFATLVMAGGFMLGDHVIRGFISRWL